MLTTAEDTLNLKNSRGHNRKSKYLKIKRGITEMTALALSSAVSTLLFLK